MMMLALLLPRPRNAPLEVDLSQIGADEYLRRLVKCRLPDRHPDPSRGVILTSHQDVRDAEAVIDAFDLATRIEKAFDALPGPSSRLRARALLVCLVLGAMRGKSYSVSDISAVLAGLPPDVAVRLRVQMKDRLVNPISYDTVRKQLRKLERVLTRGFEHDGRTYGVNWFVRCLVLAPVPTEYLDLVAALALDATDFATWAVSKDFRKEKTVTKQTGTHPDAQDNTDDDEKVLLAYDEEINAEILRKASLRLFLGFGLLGSAGSG